MTSAQTRIAGHVVDASDGRPLRHATITLFETPASNRQIAQTETDNTGAFSVAKLPAGKYRTEAAARGYITAAYDEHGQYSSAIVTGSGLDTESLTIRLQPAAMVSGRVTDEAGEPVHNADIGLFHETYETGTRRITQFRNVRTNDLGAYELSHLPPGSYYVTVRATPWYAVYQPNDPANNLGLASDIDPALNVVYPLTFYPAASESSGASAIELKPGTRFHADFQLTPQPAAHLTVQLPAPNPGGSNGNPGLSIPQLQQKIFDSADTTVQQRVQFNGQSLDIQGLAPGSYILRRLNGGANALQTVQVGGGGTVVDMSSAQPSFGSVRLLLEAKSDGKLPPIQRLNLLPASTGEPDQPFLGPGLSGNVKDGQVVIENVPPGDYRIQSANGRWHADSVAENGKAAPGARLHVTGTGQAVKVTLGNGAASVSGFVRQAGKGFPGAMVVLVPAGGDHSPELYRRDQSDLDGSFLFANVLPGDYLLVAIQDGWTLEWGRPETMMPYLQKAVPVTVPQNAHGPMSIAEAVPAQPR